MNHPTAQLAEFASNIRYEDLPTEVVDKTKECIQDLIGCVLLGSQNSAIKRMAAALPYLGEGKIPVWGTSIQSSLQNAVMLHGAMAHSTEFDDAHKQSKTHPGAAIIPAAFGIGLLDKDINGKDLIASIVAGYEILLRVGIALGAGDHRLRGWHATSTCGIFGSAVACGRLLRLNEEQMKSVLGLAGTQSFGIWAFTADGSNSKYLHAGKASQGGLLSALLARENFTGSGYIFEAEDGGFFKTYAPERKEDWKDVLTEGLGENYEILKMAYKPYPCCRTTHCAIDAALSIQEDHNLSNERIRQVTVRTYDLAVKQCGFRNPANPFLAQLSFAYVVAASLIQKRPITLKDFSEESLKDTKLMTLHNKVKVEWSAELESLFPELWPCEVEVEMMSGEKFKKRIDIAAGDPVNPMSDSDRINKFIGCADGVIDSCQAQEIISLIQDLEKLPNLQPFFQQLSNKPNTAAN